MARFRKRPTAIDAVQYDGMFSPQRQSEMLAVLDGVGWQMVSDGIAIRTANGTVVARSGDWICRQVVNGKVDVWPCAADIFAATYEPLSDGGAV